MQKTYGEQYRGFIIEVDVVRLDEQFFIADRLRMTRMRDLTTRSVSIDIHSGHYFASVVDAVESSIAMAKKKVDWLMQECWDSMCGPPLQRLSLN